MKLPDKVYNVLKWVALICLPALAVFYAVIAKIWGLPYESEIPATINAMAGVVRYPNAWTYNAGVSPFCGCNCGMM